MLEFIADAAKLAEHSAHFVCECFFKGKRRPFRSRPGGRSDYEGGFRKRKQSQSGDEPDSKQAKADSEGDGSDNGKSFVLCLNHFI